MTAGFILRAFAVLFNVVSLILICVVSFAGINETIEHIYWLKVDSSKLSIPSALFSSEYLKALSSISKTDYVGPNITAASIGEPEWFTVHLMTDCRHYSDRPLHCRSPQYGFSFVPERDLNLKAASLSHLIDNSLNDAVERWANGSKGVTFIYLASIFLTVLATIESFFVLKWAAISSVLCCILLLSVTIANTVIVKQFSNRFNDIFEGHGISTSPGSTPMALAITAAFLSILAAILYFNAVRQQSGQCKGMLLGNFGRKPTLAGAIGGHKYVQIEHQQGNVGDYPPSGPKYGEASHGSPDSLRARRLDDDWAAPDEYSGGFVSGGTKTGSGPSIPLMALGRNRAKKDLNTAYEPYSDSR